AATALALTIGVAVVCAVTVTATSLRESVGDSVSASNKADFFLKPAGTGAGISTSAATAVRGLDGIDAAVPLKYSSASVDGTRTTVVALDPTNLDRVIDLEGTIGTLDLRPGNTVIGAAEAEALGVGVGDTITVTFPETGEVTLTVTGMLADGTTALLSSP